MTVIGYCVDIERTFSSFESDKRLFLIYGYLSSSAESRHFHSPNRVFISDVRRVIFIGRDDRLRRNRIDSGLLVSLEMETPAFFGVGQKTSGASVLSVFGHHIDVHALVRR